MSDVNANINISIDSSQALGQLRALQSQISDFNRSIVAGNVAAAAAQKDLTRNLSAQINASKGFTTSITNVESSVSRLGRAIDKNKLSLGEYFRYGVAASGTFGKSMKEHAAVMELATERAKRLQTQYVAMGQAQQGMTRAMAIRPTQLFNADAAVGIQRQQIFNKLVHDGSTAMVNWGKNTQWAGRQLMVGFTVPLTIFGGVAGKIFMDLEKQVVQFKRVYGDLNTPTAERNGMVEQVKELAKEFTKYGIAVSDTVALAAKAAATGAQGEDLMAATTEATRLATLGQIDYQQALDATISLQTAFGISSKNLADSTNFLNAVENQTVTSLDDITQAIPLVAPVIKGLGGDVKDLAIFMTAMREGGISANEGANALKSGLASLINPTKAAREQLEKVGINIDSILSKNKGDLRGLVTEFGAALGTLGKFERQQTLAKMFGKYQFARLGALFQNISKEGTQAARVMDLTSMSAKELGQIAEGELGQLEAAVGVKFTAAVEKLKLAIAPIGEAFLKIATPIIEFATKIADKFNDLPDAAKTFITWGAAIGGVLVPTIIMLVGLLGNFAGNMLKIGATIGRLMGKTNGLSSGLEYLTMEELDAMAASASLEGQTNSLTGALNVQQKAVSSLAAAYGRYTAAAGMAAANLPQGFRGPARRMATGGFVAGSGNKDSEPALLMPGEFVVNKKAAQANAPLLSAMNSGTLKGYARGTQLSHVTMPFGSDTQQYKSSIAGYGLEAVVRQFGKDSVKVVSNLVAELTTSLNQALKPSIDAETGKLVAKLTKERFTEEYNKTNNKFGKAAALGSLGSFDAMQPENAAIMQKFEKELLTRIQNVKEQNIDDEILARETRILIDQYKNADGSAARLGKALDAASQQVGQVRVGIGTEATRAGLASGLLAKSGNSVLFGGVPVSRENQSGKIRPSNPRNPSRSYARAEYVARLMGLRATKASAEGAGTQSPSKITQQQGLDVAKGMEMGIEQGTPAVVDAAGRMGRSAVAQSGKQSAFGDFPLTGGPTSSLNRPNMGLQVAPPAIQNKIISNMNGMVAESATATKGMKGLGQSLMKGSAKVTGAMFALDGLVFGLSMMDNGIGQFAQQIMPAVFGLQSLQMMLPLLSNPVTATAAAIAAVGGAMWLVKKSADDVKQRSQDLAKAMYGSTESVNAMAEFFGKKTASQRLAEMRANQAAGTDLGEKALTRGQEYVASEAGQKLLEEIKMVRETLGSAEAGKALANQLEAAVLAGSIGPRMAHSIAASVGGALEDAVISADASAKIRSVMIIGQKITAKTRLKIMADIFADATSIERAMADAGMTWDGSSWITQVSMIATGAGTPDLAAANLSGALVAGQQTLNQMLDKNRLDLESDTISAETFLKRQKEILETAKQQGLTWEGVKKKFQDAYPDEMDDVDSIAQPIIDQMFSRIGEQLGTTLKDSLERVNTGQFITNMFDPQNMRDHIRMLQEQLEGASRGQARILRKEIGELQSMESATMRISIAVSSGQLSREALEKLFNGKSDEQIEQMWLKIGAMDDTDSKMFLDLLNASSGDPIVADMAINLLENNDTKKLDKLLLEVTKGKAYGIEIGLILDQTKGGLKDLTQINNKIEEFRNIPQPLTKTAVAQFLKNNDIPVFNRIDDFMALPANEQKNFMTNFVMNFETRGLAEATAGARYAAAAARAAGQDFNADAWIAAANAGISASLSFSGSSDTGGGDDNSGGSDPTGGGSDGSGGGSKEKSWLEQRIEDMQANSRLYATATKWVDQLKKDRGMFFGRIQQLRTGTRVGAKGMVSGGFKRMPEQLIEEIGAGPEGLKRLQELLGLSKKAFNNFIKRWKEENLSMTVDMMRSEVTTKNRGKRARGMLEGSIPGLGANQLSEFKFTNDQLNQLMSNPEWVESFFAAMKKSKRYQNEFLTWTKKWINSLEEEVEDTTLDDAISLIDDAFQIKEDGINRQYDAAIKPLQKQIGLNNDLIDISEKLIDAKQEEISDQERLNDLDQQAIDSYNRDIEMQQRKIEGLRREDEIRQRAADALQRELDVMSRAEQSIRDAYQKRIDALDEVARLNERILQAQQDQLGIAKALSEGDVYAAAQAAAEMQSNTVQYSADQNRAALQQGMENQVAGLTTSGGLTRAQAEAQIQAIQDQSYQTQLAIRDIEDYIYNIKQTKILPLEDAIYARNLSIRDLQNEIYNINENNIEPLKITNEDLEDQIESQERLRDLALEEMVIGEFTRDAWEQRKNELNLATVQANLNALALGGIEQKYKDIANAARDAAAQIAKIPGASAPQAATGSASASTASGYGSAWDAAAASNSAWLSSIRSNTGGRIAKYAAGSVVGAGGGDTIPAMLTPGEYVIRKSMVDKYGLPLFEDLNQGSFSMPKYGGFGRAVAGVASGGKSDVAATIAPVYNTYSVNVNASTNANPEEIATTVINKIRSIDNMSVRRVNGY